MPWVENPQSLLIVTSKATGRTVTDTGEPTNPFAGTEDNFNSPSPFQIGTGTSYSGPLGSYNTTTGAGTD